MAPNLGQFKKKAKYKSCSKQQYLIKKSQNIGKRKTTIATAIERGNRCEKANILVCVMTDESDAIIVTTDIII